MKKSRATRGYLKGPFGQVHYRRAGEGLPLILCHQSPNSSQMYEAIYGKLADQGVMAIDVFDTPGFGMSDAPDSETTLVGYAENITAVQQHLGLETSALYGHHTGGYIAAAYASRHPERISKLILFGPRPREGWSGPPAERPRSQMPTITEDGSHLLRLWRDRLSYPMEQNDLALANRHFSQSLGNWDSFVDASNAYSVHDTKSDLKNLSMPTMLMSAASGGPTEVLPQIKELRPDFAFVTIPNSTGYLIDERSDEWVSEIVRFLRK